MMCAMRIRAAILLGMLTLLIASVARAGGPDATTRPDTKGWSSQGFDYAPPKTLVVEESTPKFEHVDWRGRRPTQLDDTEELHATESPAKPYTSQGIDFVRLRFRDVDDQIVPALLCTPH